MHSWYRVMPEHISWPNRPLRWRHNDHDGGSNHQPHGCLLNRLFRRKSKKTSKLRVTGLCVGKSPGPVKSPHKGPVTRKMFPFDDVIMLHDNYRMPTRRDAKNDRTQMFNSLRHRDKMAAIFQTTYSNAFSRMKMYNFRVYCHCNLFLMVRLTIFKHWFRWWRGADQAAIHYLKQWGLVS